MLESNPSRNSQLETHPNDEQGVGGLVGALIIRIDFPMPLKLTKRSRREAASILFCRGIGQAFEPASKVPAAALRPVFSVVEAGAMRLR
jgi:hypothetical protein